MNKRMTLKDAGYREKVFVKSLLADLGMVDQFPHALEHYTYDPIKDRIYSDTGAAWPVYRDPDECLDILARMSINNLGCH